MEKYPRLREEAERVMGTFLREQEERCKSHVRTIRIIRIFKHLCLFIAFLSLSHHTSPLSSLSLSSTLSLLLSLPPLPSLLSLSKVKLMIEIELSYMNTNHPDFIGFDRYE
jgi:hypothetical protein